MTFDKVTEKENILMIYASFNLTLFPFIIKQK